MQHSTSPARSPIASVTFSSRVIPLVLPFAITGSRQAEAACVFVRIVDAMGREGWGEASPLPIVTGDTVETTLAFLTSHAGMLVGLEPGAAARLIHAEWRPLHHDAATSALCALETACLDLKARQFGVSLREILHTGSVSQVETDITVPALGPSELGVFWTHFESHRFSVYKVKVTGESHDDDLARCLAANAHVPSGGALVLDGNQGFDPRSAVKLVEDLHARGAQVRFFEQPLPRGDLKGLETLLARCPVPVCLDESIRTVADLVAHLGLSKNFMVNLKIMKSGVQESLALGLVAQAHGLGLMLGGMMETDLAMSCSLQLCAALGGVDVCDLDTPFYLRTLACEDSPWAAGSARLRVPNGPGLGLTPLPT